jgi:hypothetical protein
MRRRKFNVSGAEVQRQAADSLQSWLAGSKAIPAWLAPLLVWMAARRVSLSLAAKCFQRAPGAERVRQVMHACLPQPDQLLAGFQRDMEGLAPRRLRRRSWLLAIDLHDRPYYGQDQKSLRHAQCKQGTRRFFSYATCCLVGTRHRWTIAVLPVPAKSKPADIVDQLLDQVRAAGWKIRGLLLDRGFYSAHVILRLQQRRVPFVIPMLKRGKRGRRASEDTGTQRFFRRGCQGYFSYVWAGRNKSSPPVTIRVACVPRTDRRRGPWVYVCWRLRWQLTYLRKIYRQRFGIESSYRQLGQSLARTTSRDATYRLLLVLVSLLLRNLWVSLRFLSDSAFELCTLLEALAFQVANHLGLQLAILLSHPSHPTTNNQIQ